MSTDTQSSTDQPQKTLLKVDLSHRLSNETSVEGAFFESMQIALDRVNASLLTLLVAHENTDVSRLDPHQVASFVYNVLMSDLADAEAILNSYRGYNLDSKEGVQ